MSAQEAFEQIMAEAERSHQQELARAEWEKSDDPTPWCLGCGAMKRENCDCGPIDPMN